MGLGFAIPIDTVTQVAQELIRTGEMHHPEIGGVNARTVVNDTASGAEVANVQADSPAQRAGIVEGDVIVKVGDRTVTSADELVVAVHEQRIGGTGHRAARAQRSSRRRAGHPGIRLTRLCGRCEVTVNPL